MRTHIIVTAFIFLTVGCQPNKEGTLLSHRETDLTAGTYFKPYQENTGKKVEGSGSEMLNINGTVYAPVNKAQYLKDINARAYDAVVRLLMDMAGTMEPNAESETLEKLFRSSAGPSQLPVKKVLEQKAMNFDIKETDLVNVSDENAEITVLAMAFKQIAAAYGLDEGSQKIVEQAILKRRRMLVPIASEMSLAEANGALLQAKVNDAIYGYVVNTENFCASMEALKSASENFYSSQAPYTLPALIQRKGEYIKKYLSSLPVNCAANIEVSRQAMAEDLQNLVDAVTFDLGSLELYLTPTNTFNWEEFQNYKIKALLRESASTGQMDFSQVSCQLDGKQLKLTEPQQGEAGTIAAFDLTIHGESALVIEKSSHQRGLTVSFSSANVRVTDSKAVNFAKIKPATLVTATNLIPGAAANFQITYKVDEQSAQSTIICSVKGQ